MFLHEHPERHPHHPPRPTHEPDAVPEVEDLEERTLMSAAGEHPMSEAAVTRGHRPAAVVVHPAAGHVVSADPRVTDPGIAYGSFADDPLFAPAGPTEGDVGQGDLGDCYLLSSLASVARTDPGLIRQDVVDNGNDTYTVNFAGAKKAVTVDADLPKFADGRVAYAQLGAGNSLWVAVVEKAYATLKGARAGYAAISGGWMGDVFSAFGLKNQSVMSVRDPSTLATTLKKDLAAGDFVTYGTIDGLPLKGPLVGGHAYTVDRVGTDGKGNVTTVTVRNPWGNQLGGGREFVTITAQQAFADFGGVVVSHA